MKKAALRTNLASRWLGGLVEKKLLCTLLQHGFRHLDDAYQGFVYLGVLSTLMLDMKMSTTIIGKPRDDKCIPCK